MPRAIRTWKSTALLGTLLSAVAVSGCSVSGEAPPGPGMSGATPPGVTAGAAGVGGSVVPPGSGGSGSGPAAPATDPGRVTMHRLNLAEYDNTMRDLLGTQGHPSVDFNFPLDDRGSDFDNTADVLSVSPLHLSSYDGATTALISAALAAPAQRALLVSCDLASGGVSCAREALTSFLPKAWRREVSSAEVEQLMTIVALAASKGDSTEVGLKLALRAALLSPNFIFRPELDPDPTSLVPHALGEYELASRLSYFLWSSMPDAQLFAAAKAGHLHDPTELVNQVSRMLSDPKAKALVDNFAGQWLLTRLVDNVQPDKTQFPAFDADLRAAFKTEPQLLFREVLFNGLPADQLLTANFTFVNDRLAKFYGLPAVGSSDFRRVDLSSNTQRRGLLTQGGLLTVNSHADRTSPVLRGKYAVTQMLCLNVPPPPPDVKTALASDPTGQQTLRQVLEAHVTNAACAVCHKLMDPAGYAMENYDAIGNYRTLDNGLPVDATGTMPTTGEAFNGLLEFSSLIAKDPAFPGCVASKLYTYALGRGLVRDDPAHLDPSVLLAIARKFSSTGFQFKDLTSSIVLSPTFLTRRGELNQ